MHVQRPTAEPLGQVSSRLTRDREHPAVITATETLSYGELDRRVAHLADVLGSSPRLVAVEAVNRVEALVAYLGARQGGHPVLLLPPEGTAASRALTAAYDPGVLIGATTGWEAEPRRTVSTHSFHPDLALLLSTSGSTGSPKLVRLSGRNLDANAAAIAGFLRIDQDDRAITTLPMQYCYGLSVINSHLAAGATIVLTELSVVDRCFWDLFRGVGATSFAGVPHTFDLLDRIGFDRLSLPTLRYVTQAGGRMHPETVRRYARLGERHGWELFVMYGQTEATARMAYLPPRLAATHPHTIGKPIPGGSFAIDQPGDDGVGELVYRGPNVMLGYAERMDDLALGATVESLRTGDLGRRTPEGLYEIVGRCSRFLKLYGLRIDLDRIEALLADADIAAMCTGDDERLVIGIERTHDAQDVKDVLSDCLKIPWSHLVVIQLDELPRLASGKADLETLQRLAPSTGSVPHQEGTSPDGIDVCSEIRSSFAQVLGVEPSDDDTFVSLGGDSLSYVEMGTRLEELLGRLPRGWHLTRVADLAPIGQPRRRVVAADTTVVLRAVAIVLIVATHAGLWHLPGGAHTLVAVAGYNFARFQSGPASIVRSVARVALPSMCWIGVVAFVSDDYGWPNALLVNGFTDRPGDRWVYWFVEALVHILAVLAVLKAIPPIARLERSRPFALPMIAVIAGLLVRFDVVVLTTTRPQQRPHEVLWLFAIGWAAARASHWAQRVLVCALAVLAIHGYFGDGSRELIILAGILLIVWVPTLPIPRVGQRVVTPLAAASLYVYLTHFQVFPPLERLHGSEVAVVGSLLVGVAAWSVARRLTGVAERAIRNGRHALPARTAPEVAPAQLIVEAARSRPGRVVERRRAPQVRLDR